jgi:Xaa-Pro aminopeptidase
MLKGNTLIQNRLSKLRAKMSDMGISYMLIPTGDYHLSEYVSDYFKVREYFSGFSGSSGTLLVEQDRAGLWTDGRYFIQATLQLSGTGITLFKMQEEGVPTIEEYLARHVKVGEVLGFDGRLLSASKGEKLTEAVRNGGGEVNCFLDPAEGIWEVGSDREMGSDRERGSDPDIVSDLGNRPVLPAHTIFILSDDLTGETVTHKLSRCRTYLDEQKADGIFLSKLDELMWILNIRGGDIPCNPVAFSYGYITREEAFIFLQEGAVTEEVRAYFIQNKIQLKDYQQIQSFVEGLPEKYRILVDEDSCNFAMYQSLGSRRHAQTSPIVLWKARKNPVEISNMERIYLRDSVEVTKFIYWLKNKMQDVSRQDINEVEQISDSVLHEITNIEKVSDTVERGIKETEQISLTECSAAAYLDHLRRSLSDFLDLSFPTISAYRSNAAMTHYETSPEHDAPVNPEGFLLVDSGGQYLGGTTDVTRTITLGPLTETEIMHYTLTAAGMLSLSDACWLKGCTGRNLDILARTPLWKHGLDYRHGTGHGIGYILNVHEGPHNLHWRYRPDTPEAILEEGMVISNEPGIYIEGSHGIRIENILLVKQGQKTDDGQFLHFHTFTWVPLDPDAIDPVYFTEEQLEGYNHYQKTVYEKIAPYLTWEEREWLKVETRSLSMT